ncbi:Uncharacterised protein [Vibrio cholerae]|nr:Uncharacterised protein [Vibrio cholerae]
MKRKKPRVGGQTGRCHDHFDHFGTFECFHR